MISAALGIFLVVMLIIGRVAEILEDGHDSFGLPAWASVLLWAVVALSISIHIWRGRLS